MGFYTILITQAKGRLMEPSVISTYGFLYNGFEPEHFSFEVVHLIRKVLVLVVASIIPLQRIRVIILLAMLCFFLAVHIQAQPYDDRSYQVLDRLEFISLLAVILTLLTSIYM